MKPTTYNLRPTTLFVMVVIIGVVFMLVPFLVFAQPAGPDPSEKSTVNQRGGLVPCSEGCNFNDLIQLAENLVRWLVFISVFVAAGTFTYAGFLYAMSGGSEEQVKKAHEVFRVTVIGFLVVLSAWLIVYTIGIAVIKDERTLLLEQRSES